MRISKIVTAFSVLAAALACASTGALASHGKAGLWSVDMSIAGQDTSKIPPDALARLKAMGMNPNNSGGFTLNKCMTAADVADDSKMIDASANKNCEIMNRKLTGHSMNADMVCKGQLTGTGHVSVSFDSDTHYTGQMILNGTAADGTRVAQNQTFDGRWVAPTCGSSH